APAQIVSDARKNGVEVREVDVSHSFAQNTLEQGSGRYCAVRLGFRQIDGFHWIDPDERRLKQIQQSMRGVATDMSFSPSFRGVAIATNPEPRDSGLDAYASPRNDTEEATRNDNVEENDWADRIVKARARAPFTSLEDFAR